MHKPTTILRNESGAFDLPSIMIGVAVVAILTVGVLAAIFGVIPWSQDKAAQQDLGAVHTAQGAAFAKDGGFTSSAGLVANKLLGADTPESLDVRASVDGRKYVGVSTSKTGKKFMISAEAPTSRPLTNQDKWPDGQTIDPTAPDAPVVEAGGEVPEDEPFRAEIVSEGGSTKFICGPHRYSVSDSDRAKGESNYRLLEEGRVDEIYPVIDGWDILLVTESEAIMFSSKSMQPDNTGGPNKFSIFQDGSCAAIYSSRLGGVSDAGFERGGMSQAHFRSSGVQTAFAWVNDLGELHREGGPSWLERSPDGQQMMLEKWHTDGKLSKRDGPAVVEYDVSGGVKNQEFHVNGTLITNYAAWVEADGVPEAWIVQ